MALLTWFRAYPKGPWFRVSGFGCRVSGVGFTVSGLGFHVPKSGNPCVLSTSYTRIVGSKNILRYMGPWGEDFGSWCLMLSVFRAFGCRV